MDKWGKDKDGVDVGLSFLAQDGKTFESHWQSFIKPMKQVPEQVMYRYLIAVEVRGIRAWWMLDHVMMVVVAVSTAIPSCLS